ncbi:MAG: peptidylprolyl isomerase [bacterium]|nr:peptidylprolyl isomerase [bacterium]
MKPIHIVHKIKESGRHLRQRAKNLKPFRPKRSLPVGVSSDQFSEVIKDKASLAADYVKKGYGTLGKLDPKRVFKYGLVILLGLYIIGGIILSVIVYPNKEDKKSKSDTIKLTKRDIWLEKFASIYPLPAATVNGSYVGLGEFYRQVSYLKSFNSQVPDSLSKEITDETSLKKRVLDNLIETVIVRQEAKKNKIEVTQADVDAAFKSAADANGGTEQIEKVLKNLYNMDTDRFKKLIKDQLYREKIREKLLIQVHLKHILLTDQSKADAALARIQKGETFEAVAQSASEDSNSKAKGGDIGWLGRDDLRDKINADFEKAAFALKKGETSGIIKTQFGYHIIKIEDKKGSIDKSFSDWLGEVKQQAHIRKFVK